MYTLLYMLAAVGTLTSNDSLAAHVRERVQQVPGAEVGIAFHRIGSRVMHLAPHPGVVASLGRNGSLS